MKRRKKKEEIVLPPTPSFADQINGRITQRRVIYKDIVAKKKAAASEQSSK